MAGPTKMLVNFVVEDTPNAITMPWVYGGKHVFPSITNVGISNQKGILILLFYHHCSSLMSYTAHESLPFCNVLQLFNVITILPCI